MSHCGLLRPWLVWIWLSLSGLFQHFTVFTNQISSFSQAFELITDTLLTINQCKVWRICTIEISLILTLQTASRLRCTDTYCAPPRSQVKRRAIVLVLRDNAVKHEKTSESPTCGCDTQMYMHSGWVSAASGSFWRFDEVVIKTQIFISVHALTFSVQWKFGEASYNLTVEVWLEKVTFLS